MSRTESDAVREASRRGRERGRLRDDVPFRQRRRITVRYLAAESACRPGRNWLQTVLNTEAEARRVPEAFEPLETALTSADGLVRVFDPIVLPPAAKMGDAR